MNVRNQWSHSRFVTIALVVGGLIGGYLLAAGLDRGHGHDHAASHSADQATGGEPARAAQGRVQVYTCSMHPQVRSTDPNDKCPICGMDLIPVPEDEEDAAAGAGPELRLTPRAAALMQVEVLPAERRRLEMPVRLFGRLEQDETRLRTISAWIPGRLERLHVDFTGVAVRAGQPLMDLYSPRLIAAQEELLQALKAHRELDEGEGGIGVVRESARLTVEAARDRLRLLGIDKSQIEALEQRGRVEERVTIHAPASGVVVERLAAQGDFVEAGQPVYRLADLSQLWAQLEVYESDLAWLRIGLPARFTTQALPGEEFAGTVTFIDPALNPQTRTARVRVEIPNPDGRLKPGMFLRGTVGGTVGGQATDEAEHDHPGHEHDHAEAGPVVIPASAPLITGRRAVVYVQRRDADRPVFEPRDVLLGSRAGDWYPVEEGLSAGELVVVRGAFKIDSELQIRGRPSMMQPDGGPPPTHDHGGHAGQGGQADHGDHVAQGAAAEEPAPPSPHQAPEDFRAKLGSLVQAQFALVRALADDDPNTARNSLVSIDEALHAVDAEQLVDGSARREWNRLATTMHDALGEIGRAPGLDNQRRHFETFSDAMTEAVQAFGIEGTGPVYRAVCPMVQGRDGYWLQDEELISNPYYGEVMLRCGWVHETIIGNGS